MKIQIAFLLGILFEAVVFFAFGIEGGIAAGVVALIAINTRKIATPSKNCKVRI